LSDNVADANFVQKSWASGGELGFRKTVHAEVSAETGIRPGEVFSGSVGRIRVPMIRLVIHDTKNVYDTYLALMSPINSSLLT
jgi:hypothetical protein